MKRTNQSISGRNYNTGIFIIPTNIMRLFHSFCGKLKSPAEQKRIVVNNNISNDVSSFFFTVSFK